ncbi:(2Fe-2S)-binding protein [Pseudonocardia sp. RS010]|uniref:(2Fe-2S)-binding protein n=1 Tax=Pseudonocardia sp. RS010 TaxID=3385979 RepID=UPI0039A272BD
MTAPVRTVLADVARVGPFFAVATEPAESADPTWRPLRALGSAGPAEPGALGDRIAHVRRVLSEQAGRVVEERVAASIALQGLAARLVSAPLAAVALHGVLPDLGRDALHWRVAHTGPWPLWTDGERPVRDPAELPALVTEELAEPLVRAVRTLVPVSARVLWGNVASSVAGAKRVLGTERPEAAPRAAELAAAVLDHPLLAGAGERRPPGPADHGWTFRRRSCCLYYRLPGGGTCGDCVLSGRA